MDLVCNKMPIIQLFFGIKLVQLDDISRIFEQSNNSLNKGINYEFHLSNSNLKNEYNRLFLMFFILVCFLVTVIFENIMDLYFDNFGSDEKEKEEKDIKKIK